MIKHYSGIDPGWTNLGYAVIEVDDVSMAELVCSGVLNPSRLGVAGTAAALNAQKVFHAHRLSMERYVPYSGMQNPDSERILMVTGACIYAIGSDDSVVLHRAIDWKIRLNKWLVKNRGFSNPSPLKKLDKAFSMAAAECLFNKVFDTDHEADAACLAFVGWLGDK